MPLGEEMQQGQFIPALSINQRNLYYYFLSHRKRNKNTPCYVPKVVSQGNCTSDYLRCIEACEEKKLFRVDRSAPNYTGWILLPIEP